MWKQVLAIFVVFQTICSSFCLQENSTVPDKRCTVIKTEDKFDCFPEDGATKTSCEARGCCWEPVYNASELPPLNVPYCFYPANYPTYIFDNITETNFGYRAFLKKANGSFKSYIGDVGYLQLDVLFLSNEVLRVKIFDPKTKRYETPFPKIRLPKRTRKQVSDLYGFYFSNPNYFTIYRKADNEVLFDTRVLGNLIFSDQFIQLSTSLPSQNIYGLGEHSDGMRHTTNWDRLVFFAADQVPNVQKNLYGSQPFYLVMEESSKSHGVFFLNSNAMEVIIQPKPALTFRVLGGIIDLFIMMGPTPDKVVSQYTSLIGRSTMPPYWSLGFHLCRFGYRTLNRTKEIWLRNRKIHLPFDTQWNDLDYMDKRKDFTVDAKNFKDLPNFVKELHSVGMRYITIIDPAISANQPAGSYPPYDDGVAMDIFIRNSTGELLIGQVWPGPTVFPDFTNPKTGTYWGKCLRRFRDMVPIDGVWVDMNEPSNFVDGSLHGCPKDSRLEHPQYVPPLDHGSLAGKTICMTAKQHSSVHYNLHNLYGFTETMMTYKALASEGIRPFIISRSTFAGHGRYGGHWTGDVSSTWDQLKRSIASILNFNMYGIPMVGADICGFNGNTTEDLCQRWMQLGAFYPFSRNHNSDGNSDQDPAAFGPNVIESSKAALVIRYTLLPYLYTLFSESSRYGTTVARPLFFEFPEDKMTYGIDTQFLWGSGLHIIPALEKGDIDVTAYFPSGIWYDYHMTRKIISKGSHYVLHTKAAEINVYFQGGSIIPTQKAEVTTAQSRLNNYKLIVAYDAIGQASGHLYLDSDDVINPIESGEYSEVFFNSSQHGWFYSTIKHRKFQSTLMIGEIVFLDMGQIVPENVKVNSNVIPFEFNNVSKVMTLSGLQLPILNQVKITWQ